MALRPDVTSKTQARKRQQTTVRIQPDIWEAAAVVAERGGMSRNQLVEQLLAKYIRSNDGPRIRLKGILR